MKSSGAKPRKSATKILSVTQLARKLKTLNKRKRVVFTNGCFDLLHPGHTQYLERARALGDFLIVALNTDDSVKRLKGPTRPINRLEDRAQVMASLECVDFVTAFDQDTPLEVILALKPNLLVKGGDWKPEQIVGSTEVRAWGGRAKSLPYLEGKSTTGLVQRIKS